MIYDSLNLGSANYTQSDKKEKKLRDIFLFKECVDLSNYNSTA
jgi:hypothetical protein